MEFKTIRTEAVPEIRLSGRMEFTDHDRLVEIVTELNELRASRVVLDLSQLEFIDSAGLGMLLILQEEAESRNTKLIVRGAAGDVRRSIELARLSEIITFEH
ncbi:STAS domain-containing protein [Azospirillum lipoferum]|uniref:Anti-sigma factor antagonist n=1 Tax=Azospirillum lipoferum (strain 4B) TaxID=862719 RepID=G7Z3I4_AZOL4|nr:STAS domain-containing protein [Azospirillum lipoferum]CBS85944.1 putative anti-sigma factor antagonist [Azospirillum lipoferum 4B]